MRTKIRYEDDALLVIDKPAGLATQSARVTQADVVSELTNYLHGGYVGLVHRLDQPVEGLLVVAKTKQAAGRLSEQLGSGKLSKSYLAVVHPESQNGLPSPVQVHENGAPVTLVDYMKKDSRSQLAEIVTVKDEAHPPAGLQKAVLSYRLLESVPDLALVSVTLQTGRFHQIRAQMAHAGMSLLGDQKYASRETKRLSGELAVKYVALCADRISFVHPVTGKEMHFEKKPDGVIFQSFKGLQSKN